MVLSTTEALDKEKFGEELINDYTRDGTQMLTTAVFAIVLSAPAGAILTNTLGPMWLTKEEPKATKEEIKEGVKQMDIDTGIACKFKFSLFIFRNYGQRLT